MTYRKCETTRFNGGVTEKDKEYVKGGIREAEPGSRQAEGTYNGHGHKHPKSVWCRFLCLVFLGNRIEKSSTFAGQSLRLQVSVEVGKL